MVKIESSGLPTLGARTAIYDYTRTMCRSRRELPDPENCLAPVGDPETVAGGIVQEQGFFQVIVSKNEVKRRQIVIIEGRTLTGHVILWSDSFPGSPAVPTALKESIAGRAPKGTPAEYPTVPHDSNTARRSSGATEFFPCNTQV